MSNEHHIQSSAYRGTTSSTAHNRPIQGCEYSWESATLKPYKFDKLLTNQLVLAKLRGRDNIVVTDVGSGDAGLFKNALDYPEHTPETRAFLAANPSMRIRMIGLTDARTPSDFLKADPNFHSPPTIDAPIIAENFFYTLTAAQRLRDFLSYHGAPQADLILATCSLQYLGFLTFRQTVEDSVQALRGPGSIMIASAYSYLAPHIVGVPQDDKLNFTIPDKSFDSDPTGIKAAIRDKGKRFKQADNPEKTKEEVDALTAALKLLNRLGAVTDDSLAKLQERINSPLLRNSPESYAGLAEIALTSAQRALAKQLINKFRDKKTQILKEINQQHASEIYMDIQDKTSTGFTITKK